MKIFLLLLTAALSLSADGKLSNRRAPGFSLPDTGMEQHDTQDYRGKLLIIDIFTTTCPECQKLTKTLREIAAKQGSKIGLLSIVTMPDNFDGVRRFIKDFFVDWPILFDSGQVIASYLKLSPTNPTVHFPHLFIVDPAGTIRADYDGTDAKLLTVESLSADIAKYSK